MPPRFVTAAIMVFWLAITGTLVYDEVAPRFKAGTAPPFTIPLTAEVSKESVQWRVLQKDEPIGSGTTTIERKEGRTFELSADFTLKRIKLLVLETEQVTVKGKYRVTEEGKMLSGSAKIALSQPLPLEIVFDGEVRDSMFHPRLAVLLAGRDVNPFPPEPMAVSDSGSVMNPMHLVHRIAGLRAGQQWSIPLLDPLRAAPEAAKAAVSGIKMPVLQQVIATVTVEDFAWRDAIVPCFRIDYAKAGEAPLARTWVRRQDDAVVQQWASYEGIEFTLQRAAEQP